VNDKERQQLEREAAWSEAHRKFRERNERRRSLGLNQAIEQERADRRFGRVLDAMVMIDDHELDELQRTGRITVTGPTLDDKVVVVVLKRTRKPYSDIEGADYEP
jgi:hypothetical protein